MQISLENTGALERKLTVTLPASRLEDEIRSRLQQLSREVRLNGFRPGKVPMSVISKRFGSQVRDEVFEELVRDSFGEALRKENLRPAMSPKQSFKIDTEAVRSSAPHSRQRGNGNTSPVRLTTPVCAIEYRCGWRSS